MSVIDFFKSFNIPMELREYEKLAAKKLEVIKRNTPGSIEYKLKNLKFIKIDTGEYIKK